MNDNRIQNTSFNDDPGINRSHNVKDYMNSAAPIHLAQDEVNVLVLQDLKINCQAIGDKIWVLVDEFKSGYECPKCGGKGKIASTIVEGIERECPDCLGKGVIKGGLTIPETAKSMPSTGVVVSMGPDTEYMQAKSKSKRMNEVITRNTNKFEVEEALWSAEEAEQKLSQCLVRVGARIIFGVHVGIKIPLKGGIRLIVMREKEPLGILFGDQEVDILDKSSEEPGL